MSDLYSPDLDDSVIPLGHITTYILENDKNGNNQLEGLDFEGRINFREPYMRTKSCERLWTLRISGRDGV